MDFERNNEGLDRLRERFQSFVGQDNPNTKFVPGKFPIDLFKQAPGLTKEQLGDIALDYVSGVVSGEGADGVVSLFTGNAPGALDRTVFLCDLLSNFDVFWGWMKSHLDQREHGYSVVKEIDGENWLAIGPGFGDLQTSPSGTGLTPELALADLQRAVANTPLIADVDTDEYKQFIWGTVFTYARAHPDQPGAATVPDDQQELVITGVWTKPGTRYAVKATGRVPLLSEPDSEAMRLAKRLIVSTLWENRKRAGGVNHED